MKTAFIKYNLFYFLFVLVICEVHLGAILTSYNIPQRYMCAHALSLSHPGIRCRCLAAYGDPVSAVKWYVLWFRAFYWLLQAVGVTT